MLPLQLEGIRGRSGYSEVALVSFRGLEKREAGCVAVAERGRGWGEGVGWLRQKLFAVDGCRVHANCHQKDAEHVPVCPLCKHAQHALPHSHCPFSPPLLLCPVDLYARCGLKQRRFFSYSASDVVQTFLPSGKQQDRSSCHWALKAQPAYLYRPLPIPPLTAPRSRPATIHFELLNFEKATRAKTDIIFEDSGCSRSKKTKKK